MKFRILMLAGAAALAANGQTWLSAATGSDSNACTRSAPCKTFQHGHDVTAPYGQVNVLDAGDYGFLAIGKPITIDGGGMASNVVTSGNGINVLAISGVVQLRNLSLHGNGGANGIIFSSGGHLLIENVKVNGFTSTCISLTNNANATDVVIKDTAIDNCSSAGISVYGINMTVEIENTHSHYTNYGLTVQAGSVSVKDSSFSSPGPVGSGGNVGIQTTYYYGTPSIMVDNCIVSGFGVGIESTYGTIQVSRSTVLNASLGVEATGSALLISNGNNSLFNNGSNGLFSKTVALQ